MRWSTSGEPVPAATLSARRTPFFARYPDGGRTVQLRTRSTGVTGKLSYAIPDPQHLVLSGSLGGNHIAVRAHRSDTTFLLTSRGFHWISEDPYNR